MTKATAVEIDPARTVTHPNGITQVFATRIGDRAQSEAAIGAFRRVPGQNAYGAYAPDGSTLGTYATAPEAYAAIVHAHEGAFEVVWPDGSVYRNRHGRTRLTEDEARMTAPRIGGTWRRVAEDEAGDGSEPVRRGCKCGHSGTVHFLDFLAGGELTWCHACDCEAYEYEEA